MSKVNGVPLKSVFSILWQKIKVPKDTSNFILETNMKFYDYRLQFSHIHHLRRSSRRGGVIKILLFVLIFLMNSLIILLYFPPKKDKLFPL